MSENSFAEVTHTSYGGRIKASFTGIIFGWILFIGAFPLLFWNEGRAVKRDQTLKEGEGAVVFISLDRVEPSKQWIRLDKPGVVRTKTGDTPGGMDAFEQASRLGHQPAMRLLVARNIDW